MLFVHSIFSSTVSFNFTTTSTTTNYYYYHHQNHHQRYPFMQGIYTYIPKTNHVLTEYSVAAISSLLFMMPISLVPALALLYFYVSTFRSMCAVPNMAVFCSSFTSWFPGMLLMYFLKDFEMVPVAPVISGITLGFTFHMRCISIVRFLYLISSGLPF